MSLMTIGSCLFLDRDGIINIDKGYVYKVDDFHFVPGIFQLARVAKQTLGWQIVVITNQSGIGRGYFDEDSFDTLTQWMKMRFEAEGAALLDVLHCPYHPDACITKYRLEHPWRKPSPGMILEAQRRYGLNLERSALVGDSDRDVLAGLKANVGLLIKVGKPAFGPGVSAPFRYAADLEEACAILLKWSLRSA